jgi:hypothetical protein
VSDVSTPRPTPVRRGPPWPLYPKLVFVAILLGGFVAVLVLVLATPLESREDWRALLDAVGRIITLAIVPGSFLTVVFSLVLLRYGGRAFLRQRWAQAKLVLLVLTLPALHLTARGTFSAMRREVEQGSPEGPTGLFEFFTVLVVTTIVVLLLALWLARFKPRLGQRS